MHNVGMVGAGAFETQFLKTPRGAAWRRWGKSADGHCLMLCHGLASNGSRWQELAAFLVDKGGWTVLAPDLRGHGRSERRGRIDSQVWIRDIEDILSVEQPRRLVLGGHCLGANLALRYAAALPQPLAGLVLIEPMLPAARTGKTRLWARLRGLLRPASVLVRGINALGIKRKTFPELHLLELDRETRRCMAEEGSDAAMTRRYASPIPDLKHLPLASYLQSLDETLRPLPDLESIVTPTLALLSSGGLFGDPQVTRKCLEQMPTCRIVEVQARHWIPTEQPEALQHHVARFLDEAAVR